MGLWARRRMKKAAVEALRQARALRNMREDLMNREQLDRLSQAQNMLVELLKVADYGRMNIGIEQLYRVIEAIAPNRSYPGLRENLEVIVVAVAVAMAFRTYFLQPFKIPTGSMQPTLYGIHSDGWVKRGFWDYMPMKAGKWFITGKWYREIRARASGHIGGELTEDQYRPSILYLSIAGKRHAIPKDAITRRELAIPADGYVEEGHVLWAGIVNAGDHVFVDRMRWNFTRPKRGQVLVFSTKGIRGVIPNTHYIKRLVGMPGESVAVDPPNLIVNGRPLREPEAIRRIEDGELAGIPGYMFAQGRDAVLTDRSAVITLGPDQYLAMGDNTRSSLDGRYWGAVPAENTIGPGCFVYWPFTKRWGLIR